MLPNTKEKSNMASQIEDLASNNNRDYELELDFFRKKRQEYTAKLTEFEAQLMALETKRGKLALGESVADLSEIDGEIVGVRDKVQTWSESVQRANKIINSLERKEKVPRALRDFDRFAKESVEIATEMGVHSAKIAILARRGQESALNLNRFVSGLFPEGAAFHSRWGTRTGELGSIVGEPDGESRFQALEEMAKVGDFVRSRMESLRIAIEIELKHRS
jgi:hypothetical protein